MLADGGDLADDGVADDFLSDAGAGEGADDLAGRDPAEFVLAVEIGQLLSHGLKTNMPRPKV